MTIDADRKIKELARAIIADAGLPYTPEQLAEIPAILAAKNRYFWCIDNQEFDLMPDVFTETGFRTFWSGRPGFRVRDAQAVDKLRLLAEFFERFRDLGPAAVHEHDLHPDERQQHDVAHDGVFELGADHGVAAVFDDDDLAAVFLYVGQRVDE